MKPASAGGRGLFGCGVGLGCVIHVWPMSLPELIMPGMAITHVMAHE